VGRGLRCTQRLEEGGNCTGTREHAGGKGCQDFKINKKNPNKSVSREKRERRDLTENTGDSVPFLRTGGRGGSRLSKLEMKRFSSIREREKRDRVNRGKSLSEQKIGVSAKGRDTGKGPSRNSPERRRSCEGMKRELAPEGGKKLLRKAERVPHRKGTDGSEGAARFFRQKKKNGSRS